MVTVSSPRVTSKRLVKKITDPVLLFNIFLTCLSAPHIINLLITRGHWDGNPGPEAGLLVQPQAVKKKMEPPIFQAQNVLLTAFRET